MKEDCLIDIIIADDHELIRSGLKMILAEHEHITVKREVATFAALLAELSTEIYDILILDMNLGDKNGLETIEAVSNAHPKLPILVLSAFSEEQYAVHAFKAGASGYLNKSVFSPELLTAIDTVASGKKFVSKSLYETLAFGLNLDKEDHASVELLSKRELEVLTQFCSGKTYKQIAETLNLSPKTVATYRSRILDKLNLTSTAQLLRFTYEHHICDA